MGWLGKSTVCFHHQLQGFPRSIFDKHLSRQGVEVLEAFIAKVEAEPLVNAVVVKDYARARQRAARADECWRDSRGQCLWGRLHGLPMTVKEEVEALR